MCDLKDTKDKQEQKLAFLTKEIVTKNRVSVNEYKNVFFLSEVIATPQNILKKSAKKNEVLPAEACCNSRLFRTVFWDGYYGNLRPKKATLPNIFSSVSVTISPGDRIDKTLYLGSLQTNNIRMKKNKDKLSIKLRLKLVLFGKTFVKEALI